MESTQNLEILDKKRDSVKSKLTIFKKYVETVKDRRCNSETPLDAIEVCGLEQRIERIDSLLMKFDEIQGEIDCVTDNAEEQFIEREEFEELFQNTVAIARELLASYKKASDANLDMHSSASTVSALGHSDLTGISLPVIEMPKFDGTYERWLEFRDTFWSLIHTNNKISDIQKFHYLRSSLEGDAAQVIEALGFSADNYPVAWDLLQSRFNSTRLLVYNHVSALFKLERINSESSIKIRRLIDNVSKHLKSLNILGQPTTHWDTLLIYMITTKLDEVTIREWEHHKSENDTPSLENLKQFLKGKADLLETLESRRSDGEEYQMVNDGSHCTFCKGAHAIQNCDDFLKLSKNERKKHVKQARMCSNCLGRGHYKNFCKADACEKCNAKHHVLLHPEDANGHDD